MRILFVDQFSEVGGAQRCFLDLLPALKECGWSVEAALPGDGPLAARLKATTLASGPYASGSKTGADVFRFARDLQSQIRTLGSLISNGDFDLVYANGPRILPGVAMAARGRVPVLFHAHNYLERSYAAAIAGWSVRRHAASAVACSDHVAAPLRRYIEPERLNIVPNGCSDLGYVQRSFDQPWRIGIVGRIEPQKGQHTFLRAAARIPNARFLIAGAASERTASYLNSLHDQARDLPVEFLGWQEDRAALFRRLDLLVIASEQEGLPLVMLEAFSAGVPVIAFPIGGTPEAIQHDATGFLVRGSTSEALAIAIRQLMVGNRAKLRRVAASARSLWEQSFNITQYRQRMIEVLHRAAFGTASRQ